MSMTRTQFVTEVANSIHRDSSSFARDGTTTLETRIERWLDWAQTKIIRDASVLHRYEFSFMQGTSTISFTNGTASYDIPTKTKSIYNLKVTTSAKPFYLIYKSPEDFDRKVPDPSNRTGSTPIFYTVWEQSLEVYPVPDTSLSGSLRRSKWPTDFSSDSDTSSLENMDDVITACAVTIAYENLREIDDGGYWKNVYKERLTAAIRADINTTIPMEERDVEVEDVSANENTNE